MLFQCWPTVHDAGSTFRVGWGDDISAINSRCHNVEPLLAHLLRPGPTQQTQTICITFVQRRWIKIEQMFRVCWATMA